RVQGRAVVVRHIRFPNDVDSFFFFEAEDGIRDDLVTGVQTCALPISLTSHRTGTPGDGKSRRTRSPRPRRTSWLTSPPTRRAREIGRASCRERVERSVVGRGRIQKTQQGSSRRAEERGKE